MANFETLTEADLQARVAGEQLSRWNEAILKAKTKKKRNEAEKKYDYWVEKFNSAQDKRNLERF